MSLNKWVTLLIVLDQIIENVVIVCIELLLMKVRLLLKGWKTVRVAIITVTKIFL